MTHNAYTAGQQQALRAVGLFKYASGIVPYNPLFAASQSIGGGAPARTMGQKAVEFARGLKANKAMIGAGAGLAAGAGLGAVNSMGPEVHEGDRRAAIVGNALVGGLAGHALGSRLPSSTQNAAAPVGSAADRFMQHLRKDMPGASDRDLRRVLHPDAVGRTPGVNQDVAAEAYRSLGRNGTRR